MEHSDSVEGWWFDFRSPQLFLQCPVSQLWKWLWGCPPLSAPLVEGVQYVTSLRSAPEAVGWTWGRIPEDYPSCPADKDGDSWAGHSNFVRAALSEFEAAFRSSKSGCSVRSGSLSPLLRGRSSALILGLASRRCPLSLRSKTGPQWVSERDWNTARPGLEPGLNRCKPMLHQEQKEVWFWL